MSWLTLVLSQPEIRQTYQSWMYFYQTYTRAFGSLSNSNRALSGSQSQSCYSNNHATNPW